MNIPGLTLIGESINDSVPSTHQLFEEKNIDGIVDLARLQAEKGAAYIDVNVGPRTPGFMAEVVKKIQEHVSLPLSIDTPDPAIAEAGLQAYSPDRAGNRKPILNSISEGRLQMFDFYSIQPFIPILLITERMNSSDEMVMNTTGEEIHATALNILKVAHLRIPNLKNDQIIVDPGIMPIGSDSKGDFKRLIKAMSLIHNDKELCDINMSVGLSNFTVMLPPKKPDGTPVRGPLESAFLTMAMPLGINTIIGSVHRKYSILKENDPAMICLKEVLNLEGADAIMRVMMFYS